MCVCVCVCVCVVCVCVCVCVCVKEKEQFASAANNPDSNSRFPLNVLLKLEISRHFNAK